VAGSAVVPEFVIAPLVAGEWSQALPIRDVAASASLNVVPLYVQGAGLFVSYDPRLCLRSAISGVGEVTGSLESFRVTYPTIGRPTSLRLDTIAIGISRTVL
jgi:hypothetical protein